ncbi:hypothetical protein AAVH_22065, partial [Aphelenchoides avenae]
VAPTRTELYGFNSSRNNHNGGAIFTGCEPLEACPGRGRNATDMTLSMDLKIIDASPEA